MKISYKTVIQKWKSLSPVAKTSLALIIAKFFQKGLSLISAPIFTRIMSTGEYGIISTFTSWQSILYIIATLNMSSGCFNNGMLDYAQDRDGFTSSILRLANGCTLLLCGLYLVFFKACNSFLELPQVLIWIMLVYFFVTPAYNYWMGRQRFEHKYKAVLALSVISSLIPVILAIIFVLLASDEHKAIAKVTGTEMSAIAIGLFFFVMTIRKGRGKFRWEYCTYALKINLPLIPHYLSMYLLSSSDRIMITKLIDTSATAIYSVAYTTASVILIFWNAIDAAYAPWIYEKMKEADYAPIRRRGNDIILIFAIVAMLSALFAPEIIAILAPPEYYTGVYVIPSVVAGVYFTAVYTLYMRIELYLKKTVPIMISTTAAALTNLGLNYLLIPRYGVIAAGYTTLACYVLLAVFHYFNVRMAGYGQAYHARTIFISSAMVCACMLLISLIYPYYLVRYLVIGILMVILYRNRKKLMELISKKKR